MVHAALAALAAHARRGTQKAVNSFGKAKGFAPSRHKLSPPKQQQQQPRQRVGPVSTLDMGRFGSLQGVSPQMRTTHLNTLDKITSFDQLLVPDELRQRLRPPLLRAANMPPTPVQKIAIKAISSKKPNPQSYLISAETGSGKTLAYLLPLLTHMLRSPQIGDRPCVRSIVLAPTVELVDQVWRTANELMPPEMQLAACAGVDQHISGINKLAKLKNKIDLLVTTPDKLLRLESEFPHLVENCTQCVVDEADSLFNRSFSESTKLALKNLPQLTTTVFVSATVPRFFERFLNEEYPNTVKLLTPSIHRLPRHLRFNVVEAWRRPYNNSKEMALKQALYAMYHDNSEPGLTKRCVVFVNKSKDVDRVVNFLRAANFDAFKIDRSNGNLAEFAKGAQPRETGGTLRVLVATDLAGRGIDFKGLKNVVLYDMPPTAADLLHRAGRTGRLGSGGRVLLIVSKGESKGWVRGLETIVKRGMALA